MANSDVKLKHKVQLRKKVEEPEVAVETGGAETCNASTLDKSGSKIWPWILLGVICVCIIVYFIFSKSGDTTVTEPEQGTEIYEETIVPTDSATNQEEAMAEVLPAVENDVSNHADNQEAKVNKATVTTDNNSNTADTTTSNANVSNDIEAEAMKVIRGDYGVGQERKDKLGTKYQTIQSRVNELKREGAF